MQRDILIGKWCMSVCGEVSYKRISVQGNKFDVKSINRFDIQDEKKTNAASYIYRKLVRVSLR